eukprot:225738-Prymnesium_polylepis.1
MSTVSSRSIVRDDRLRCLSVPGAGTPSAQVSTLRESCWMAMLRSTEHSRRSTPSIDRLAMGSSDKKSGTAPGSSGVDVVLQRGALVST